MVQLLMLNRADKDATDGYEHTPLYLAVYRGHIAATVALLVAGAHVRNRCRIGSSPHGLLHVGVDRTRGGR